jgi:hypothetical protein
MPLFDELSDEDGPRSEGIVDLRDGSVKLRKSAPMSVIKKLLREAPAAVGRDPFMVGVRTRGLTDDQKATARAAAASQGVPKIGVA